MQNENDNDEKPCTDIEQLIDEEVEVWLQSGILITRDKAQEIVERRFWTWWN